MKAQGQKTGYTGVAAAVFRRAGDSEQGVPELFRKARKPVVFFRLVGKCLGKSGGHTGGGRYVLGAGPQSLFLPAAMKDGGKGHTLFPVQNTGPLGAAKFMGGKRKQGNPQFIRV